MTEARRLEVGIVDKFSRPARNIAGAATTVDKRAQAMGRAITALDGKVERIGQTSQTTVRLLKGMGIAFGAVVGAQLVRSAGRAGFEMAELAGKVSTLRTSFLALSQGAGVSPNKILNQIERGARDTVSEVQALTLANTALATGVRPLVDNLGDVVQNVRSLSLALGRDATEDIERFIGAIQKQERELLDDLTIVVGANEAYSKYAKSIGKSTGALSASERQLAFANEALSQLKSRVKELGPTTNEFADGIARASATFTDLKTSLGFLTAPAFVNAASSLQTFLGDKQTQQNIAALASGFTAIGVVALKAAAGFGGVIAQAGDLSPLADKLQKWADTAVPKFLGVADALKEIAKQLREVNITAGGALDSGLPAAGSKGNPVVATGQTSEAPRPFDFVPLIRAIDDVGRAFGSLEPRLGVAASAIVGISANIGTGNPFGAFVTGAGAAIELLGGSGVTAHEKYRRKLQETNRALDAAADAVELFGSSTSQSLTQAGLQSRVDAKATLTGFGVGSDRDLKLLFGSGDNRDLALEPLAKKFGLSLEEFIKQLEDAISFFPGVDPTQAGSFDAIVGIADTAAAQLARFGDFDKSTFAGARGDFGFQKSIARPGADPRTIFENSFGDLVKSFNTSDLSFVLEEGVALSSAQTRTLKELLAELRDFHTDATQETAIVERLVRERFRGEELAVRGKFAGRFAAADGDPAETNNLLRQMARELDALATEEKAFVRAVSRGDLGSTLGTGLDASAGAAKSSASVFPSGNPVADLIDFDSVEPVSIPVNDVLRITGRVSFLRWDQALNFDDAEPSRAKWPETVVLEAASNLRHVPPDGFGSIVDVGPGTPPIDVSWPKVIRPFVDPSQRWAPGDYGTLVKIDASTPPIELGYPSAVLFKAVDADRHPIGNYGDLVSLEGTIQLRRAFADAVEFAAYNRQALPTYGDAVEIGAATPKLARAWSAALELHPWARQTLEQWSDTAQVDEGIPKIGRSWPTAVSLSYGGADRLTPNFWGAIATIPGDTTRLARSWPTAISLSAGGTDRHKLNYWGNAAFIASDTTRLARSWAAAVSLSAGGSDRHTPGYWGQIATIPGDTMKLSRIWPSVVSLQPAASSRLTPGAWGVLVDIPSTLAKLNRMWPTTVELSPAASLRATPGQWSTLVDIPSTTVKVGRMWPSTVQMFSGGGKHTLNHWADAVDIAPDTSRLYRFWHQTAQMSEGPNFLKHTPGTWADLVYMPPNLGGRLQLNPVDFAEIVGDPVPVDVNQLFTPVGQLAVDPATVAAPPSDPYSGSPLSPFQIDAGNGGGDFFSNNWNTFGG